MWLVPIHVAWSVLIWFCQRLPKWAACMLSSHCNAIHVSRFRNLSYIKVATPKMLTFELGNMWWSSAQRWKALAEAILVRHFIFWTEKKIDSKNGLKVERKSRKMLVWHDALCFFGTFQLAHHRMGVSNECAKGFDPNQLGTWWTRRGHLNESLKNEILKPHNSATNAI